MSFKELTLVGAMALALAACGGGGGGDTGGGGGGLPPVGTFTGSTVDAVLTQQNVGDYLTLLFGGPATLASDGGFLAQPQSAGLMPTPHGLIALAGFGQKSGPKPRASVNETMPCISGSVQITGNMNENDGTGTLNLLFNSCDDGSVEISGRATVVIESFDLYREIPSDFTIGYDGTIVRSDSDGEVMLQGTQVVKSAESCNEVLVTNLVGTSSNMRRNYHAKQLRQAAVCSVNDQSVVVAEQQISGELFVGNSGRVTISTQSPLVWSDMSMPGGDGFAEQLTQGVLRLESSQSVFIVEGHLQEDMYETAGYPLVRLMLDADKNGVYELDETFSSSLLSAPGQIDFADDDSDGIWNVWERLYSLNPEYNDSAEDPDGDGASNLVEFFAGTHPYRYASSPIRSVAFDESQFLSWRSAAVGDLLSLPLTLEYSEISRAYARLYPTAELKLVLPNQQTNIEFGSDYQCSNDSGLEIICSIPTAHLTTGLDIGALFWQPQQPGSGYVEITLTIGGSLIAQGSVVFDATLYL